MNMKRMLSRIFRDYGAFHVKGAFGYLSLELNPNTARDEKPADTAASNETGEGLSEAEISLLSKLSTLTAEDRSALIRFASYASGSADAAPDYESAQTDEAAHDDSGAHIASWLDEQARMHTEKPPNP